ncbi:MAG: quinolinate synthase NadA [Deltaproteobacteria bacterium]|nr:quinolinate synthase NadA [Deltaproteobacteria bacterium]
MTLPVFPSLRITADALVPQGAFAEAQAAFLRPDPGLVAQLQSLLREKNAGVVAHFYMDPELQGALSACDWPHIHVSDSLAMADRAISMAEQGVSTIAVLGVDFMSENVRAMLDASGHSHIPVYRVAVEPIGCSLAESAEAEAYGAYLMNAAETPRSLHVVYINTSLVTKAKAHAIVPTITCTSSNVVRTVLQAAAQIPGVHIWFGPDTYMGDNLAHMFKNLAEMPDRQIRQLHSQHDQGTVRSLLPRFHYFEQGTCIVHHMFGREVVELVRAHYADVFVTAHLEVPGEMFELGLQAQREGNGVVGSTSNILAFILGKVDEAIARGEQANLRFILGTEAGMITPIVRQVQAKLRDYASEGGAALSAEIVFPVASEAVAQDPQSGLGVLPGVAGGEGCSTAGGCATCPYMKMNSLQALMGLLERIDSEPQSSLVPFEPRKYVQEIRGRTVADLGGEPILHMRAFQRSGELPHALVADVLGRAAGGRASEA